MKRGVVLAFFLVGCSTSAPATPMNQDASADVAPAPVCAIVTGIQLSGAPNTAQKTFMASVKETGARADYTVAWSATLGAVTPDSGKSTTWTFDKSAGMNGSETGTLTAVVSAPGCDDATFSVDETIDYTDAERTIVLYNAMVQGSKDVADYYASYRNIDASHVCPVMSQSAEYLDVMTYPAILDAMQACVTKAGPQIYYVVNVWGVPYLVANQIFDISNNGSKATVSLDALLALGERSRTMATAVKNPIYRTGVSIMNKYDPYVPFGQLRGKYKKDYYLVARIDGADVAASKALVDRTKAADDLAKKKQLSGTVYVDGNRGVPHPMTADFGSYEGGEWTIIGVEDVFKAQSWPKIVADYNGAEFGTAPAPLTCPDALYYAGWYSFNHYNDVFTWNVGAIGGHLDSCSACSFRQATSWSALALRRGITATFGAVSEPYVAGMPGYDQFFLYLLQGASFGEAAYESTPIGGWMMVWLGDPLYRPYAK